MSIDCTRSELRTEDEDMQQLRAAGNLCGLLIVHRLDRNQTDEFRVKKMMLLTFVIAKVTTIHMWLQWDLGLRL